MSYLTVNRLVTVAFVIALAGSVAAAGALGGGSAAQQTQTEDEPQDTSYLRVVHASPDAPPVNVTVDGNRTLTNVPFGAVSDYLAFESGNHTVTITTAGDNATPVFEGNVTLPPRSVNTLFATGEVGENASAPFEPVRFEDDAFTPGDNESAMSVAHLAPDAPAVDVTAGNGSVVLADDLGFQNATNYVTVPAGNYTVEIRAATPGNNGTVVATTDVALEGGTAYSALAIGYLNPDQAPAATPFEVALTEDASLTLELPREEENGTAT